MEIGQLSTLAETADWASRSAYWRREQKPISLRRRGPSLILCGHGLSLSVDKGTLLIRDGLTHYPQERIERRIFPGDPTRPQRILILDGSGNLSLAALDWLRAQGIALIRIDFSGAATVIAGNIGYAADPPAWRRQMAVHADQRRKLATARLLIEHKLANSAATLRACLPDTEHRAKALAVIAEKTTVLRQRKPLTISQLHGVEGRAAKVYFDAWVGAQLTWKALKRHPIPESWRSIGQRQSLVTGKKGKNRDASHPLNAMLNYAYAVLEAHVRLEVLARGYDPRLGFLHSGYRGAPALVHDLMEPLRPVLDAAILRFALAETFTGADFMLRPDGVCRLNQQLARRVAQIAAEVCATAGSALPSRLLSN